MADKNSNAASRCAQQKTSQNGINASNCVARQEQFAVGESAGPILPLRYAGGNLGFGGDGEPLIYFVDACGVRFQAPSLQWVLRNIDHFATGRDQDSLLAGAAMHYGFDDPYALFGVAFFCKLDISADGVLFVKVARGDKLIRMGLERALLSFEHYSCRSKVKLVNALANHFDFDASAAKRRLQGAAA